MFHQQHSPPSLAVCLPLLVLMVSCSGSGFMNGESPLAETHQQISWYDYEILQEFPHDTTAFTQGLLFHNGYLYESTGRRGESSLRIIQPETGVVIRKRDMDDTYFAEGLALWNGRLFQVTLDAGVAFAYRPENLEMLEIYSFPGEGWGIAAWDQHLILSDGSSTLRFLDPQNFEEVKRVEVTEKGLPIHHINELERVRDLLFANILFKDYILMIDPTEGTVIGRIDLSGLIPAEKLPSPAAVLNGIAYDPASNRLFVTGKLWPTLFEIRIFPRSSQDTGTTPADSLSSGL